MHQHGVDFGLGQESEKRGDFGCGVREGVECKARKAAGGHYVCAEDGDGLGAVVEGVQSGEFEVL